MNDVICKKNKNLRDDWWQFRLFWWLERRDNGEIIRNEPRVDLVSDLEKVSRDGTEWWDNGNP